MTRIHVAINGAAGRMGQRLVALGHADKELAVVAALEAHGHPKLGADAGTLAGIGPIGVLIADSLAGSHDGGAEVVIDFSTPAGTSAILETCRRHKLPLVLATTGLEGKHQTQLREVAKTIPLLWAPSMSLAVNLAMKLTQIAAQALKDHPSGADVEIIERHHRFKEDSPSGTALKFGEIVAGAMGQGVSRHGREGRPGTASRRDRLPRRPRGR